MSASNDADRVAQRLLAAEQRVSELDAINDEIKEAGSVYHERAEKAEAERDRLAEALRELVRVKRMKNTVGVTHRDEYEALKAKAWEGACHALVALASREARR